MHQAIRTTKTYDLIIEGQKGRGVNVALAGRLALENVATVKAELERLLEEMLPGEVNLDLSRLEFLDSSGALVLRTLERDAQRKRVSVAFVNPTPEAQRVLALINLKALETPALRQEEELNFFEQVGQSALGVWEEAQRLLSFFGELLSALAGSVIRPLQIRWREVLVYMQRTGVEALPILGLMSLLMGLVVSFMSSFQLRQFGALIFVADLVGIGFVRELGALLTGILISGRSSSAFAAEIGTMKVNEEVDALEVMGFEPLRFLAVPKVLATMFVMPVLTVYCIFFGLLGGFIVGVYVLKINTFAYIDQTQKALSIFDLYYSLVKSVVFGMVIAGIGCQRGFQVRGGAQQVGTATTSAVVTSLFLIIMLNSIFSVVQNYLK
ncbi:MAG: MlaE family lipid ABC transporter permease subunit [Desulfobaccales bacterium]